MFCMPVLIFDGTEGVGSHFHVLRSLSRFQRFRGRRVPASYFSQSYSFSAVPWPLASVFMCLAPGLVFSGTDGVGSRFHILHALTHFWLYRGRRVPFSCFARMN
jgi:hypothetical protein